jgi:hypothetical protein
MHVYIRERERSESVWTECMGLVLYLLSFKEYRISLSTAEPFRYLFTVSRLLPSSTTQVPSGTTTSSNRTPTTVLPYCMVAETPRRRKSEYRIHSLWIGGAHIAPSNDNACPDSVVWCNNTSPSWQKVMRVPRETKYLFTWPIGKILETQRNEAQQFLAKKKRRVWLIVAADDF